MGLVDEARHFHHQHVGAQPRERDDADDDEEGVSLSNEVLGHNSMPAFLSDRGAGGAPSP
jgi:hypothetical protein